MSETELTPLESYTDRTKTALAHGIPPNPYIWLYRDAIPVIELMHHEYKGHYGEKHRLCKNATSNVKLIKYKIKQMYEPCKKRLNFMSKFGGGAAANQATAQTQEQSPQSPEDSKPALGSKYNHKPTTTVGNAGAKNSPAQSTASGRTSIMGQGMAALAAAASRKKAAKKVVFGEELRAKMKDIATTCEVEMISRPKKS